MDRNKIIAAVKDQMPAKRWEHTQGVMTTAVLLARRFGGDETKADLAAILHDYAKYWPVSKMESIIREQGLPSELLEHDKQLWHAPVAAYVVERDFGITDREVLDAVRYHTSGREQMTLLDKIVCLADYMEPGRDFPGVEHIRQLAESDLDQALVAGFDSTLQFLIVQHKRIFPLTVMARNALLLQVGG
jgi:predicted HD superfamily hydrolase involved in NAD metabolism